MVQLLLWLRRAWEVGSVASLAETGATAPVSRAQESGTLEREALSTLKSSTLKILERADMERTSWRRQPDFVLPLGPPMAEPGADHGLSKGSAGSSTARHSGDSNGEGDGRQ